MANDKPHIDLDVLSDEVESLIADYLRPGNTHQCHVREDILLERFVRDKAFEGDPAAAILATLLDAPRTRWYS